MKEYLSDQRRRNQLAAAMLSRIPMSQRATTGVDRHFCADPGVVVMGDDPPYLSKLSEILAATGVRFQLPDPADLYARRVPPPWPTPAPKQPPKFEIREPTEDELRWAEFEGGEFEGFGKVPRLSRECVITEKIDGTNGVIHIGKVPAGASTDNAMFHVNGDHYAIRAGSRTRWLEPGDDNYGFASWVYAHAEELIAGLGVGRHFGEWWGRGIQRGYGLAEKRFSLFNVARWADRKRQHFLIGKQSYAPSCCYVVPVLWCGEFDTEAVKRVLHSLELHGSSASPFYDRPEGVVVFHTASNSMFKKTLVKDEAPKGAQ